MVYTKFTMKLVLDICEFSLFTIFTNGCIIGFGVRLRQTCTVHPHCALVTPNPVYSIFVTVVILLEANCILVSIVFSVALPCILSSRVVLAQSKLSFCLLKRKYSVFHVSDWLCALF